VTGAIPMVQMYRYGEIRGYRCLCCDRRCHH
jgi:hypothetical protein